MPHAGDTRVRIAGFIVIMPGRPDGQSFGFVAEIFAMKGFGGVFEMSHHKHASAVGRGGYACSAFGALGQKEQARPDNVGGIHFGVPAVRHGETGEETIHERMVEYEDILGKYAEHFLRQRLFVNAVMVVKAGLCRPADEERRGDMCVGPVENSIAAASSALVRRAGVPPGHR